MQSGSRRDWASGVLPATPKAPQDRGEGPQGARSDGWEPRGLGGEGSLVQARLFVSLWCCFSSSEPVAVAISPLCLCSVFNCSRLLFSGQRGFWPGAKRTERRLFPGRTSRVARGARPASAYVPLSSPTPPGPGRNEGELIKACQEF